MAVMVEKERSVERPLGYQEFIERRCVTQPPVRVSGAVLGERKNVMGPFDAEREEYHAKVRPLPPLPAALPKSPDIILIRFVREKFGTDAGTDRAIDWFRTAIKLEEDIERSARGHELDVAIGSDAIGTGFQDQLILAVEVGHPHAGCVRRDKHLDDNIRQCQRVSESRRG